MPNYQEYLRQIRTNVQELSVEELRAERLATANALLVDVREPDEHLQGVIPGAVLIPRGCSRENRKRSARSKRTHRFVPSGWSSIGARGQQSVAMGYGNVRSLAGESQRGGRRAAQLKNRRCFLPSSAVAIRGTSCCPKSGKAATLLKSRVLLIGAGGPGDRHRRTILRRRASARWASSTATSSRNQTSSGRSCTTPVGSVALSSLRQRRSRS